jgi:tetratricopeptide (TPR) repeat protein
VPVVADLETAYASLLDDLGQTADAHAHAERGLALRRQQDASGPLADTLNVLGLIEQHQEHLERAEALFREALALLEPSDSPRRGRLLHNLAYLASARGEWTVAEVGFQEALEERRRSAEPRGEAETRAMLGAVHQALAADADPEEQSRRRAAARALHEEALAFFQDAGDRFWEAVTLYNLGELAHDVGDLPDSARRFTRAHRLFRELGAAPAAAAEEWLERLRTELGPDAFPAGEAA